MPFFCLYATSACILLFILLQLHIPSLRLSHLLLLFVLLIDCLSRSAVYCTTTPAYLFSLHSKLIAYFPAPQCMRISFCLHTLLHIPTMTAHHISVCLFSPLNPAHPPFVWIDNPPSPAYPFPVLHPLFPSVCLFALLNDCLSCFLFVHYTTKPALYTYIAFSSFCISFCLSACVRLSVFAITAHAISVSVCSIPPCMH